ncbi:MAG: hypothetical protein HY788_17425 [Deltaproteobacteria bacterium]|nr:hypothetical protein [Deltaproteobacteria bacterium]
MERRDRVLGFLTEARATQSVAENRYLRGPVSYLTVLDAQQARFQAEVNPVLVDPAVLTDRAGLHSDVAVNILKYGYKLDSFTRLKPLRKLPIFT